MGNKETKAATMSDKVSTVIDSRIQELILQKEANPHETVHPFNKILLKFPLIRLTFKSIKKAFDAYDTNNSGTIEYAELVAALKKLGCNADSVDIADVFHEADFYDNGELNFKEFVICLALGYLLGYIPILKTESHVDSPSQQSASERAAAAAVAGQSEHAGKVVEASEIEKLKNLPANEIEDSLRRGDGAAISYAFHLALEAFFHLDAKHNGVIRRAELEESMARLAMMSPSAQMKQRSSPGGHKSSNSMIQHSQILGFLTNDRWQELDWDKDGQITFKEFLHAFIAWVGLDDDGEDELPDTDTSVGFSVTTDSSTTAPVAGDRPRRRSCIKSPLSADDSDSSSFASRKVRINDDTSA